MDYYGPGLPFIIVKRLTEKIIAETLEAYASENDGYWLKLHHFSNNIDTAVFDKLRAEHIEELKELDELNNA